MPLRPLILPVSLLALACTPAPPPPADPVPPVRDTLPCSPAAGQQGTPIDSTVCPPAGTA